MDDLLCTYRYLPPTPSPRTPCAHVCKRMERERGVRGSNKYVTCIILGVEPGYTHSEGGGT